MDKQVYRTLVYARDLLKDLQSLLEGEESVRASEVRGRLQRFEACVKELEESVEEWLRRDCNELLQQVGARLENLQRYPPEDYLNESEREEILKKELPHWRGILGEINVEVRFGFLPTLLEHLKEESERGELDWSRVYEKLRELRGYFKKLEGFYSKCEYLQNIMVEFEAYLVEVETKSGKLSQEDRDRLAASCNEWRENLKTVFFSCSPPVSEEHGKERGVQEKEERGLPVSLLCFEIAGESYCVEASPDRRLVVGRYDPGGLDPVIGGKAPDGLKILEGGNVLYVFNSVECRWGCVKPDRDCTHREHVEVEVREGTVAVRMAEGAELPVYYGFTRMERKLLRREDTVLLKPGQRLYLWISGVYRDARQKFDQVPLLLSFESRRGRATVLPS